MGRRTGSFLSHYQARFIYDRAEANRTTIPAIKGALEPDHEIFRSSTAYEHVILAPIDTAVARNHRKRVKTTRGSEMIGTADDSDADFDVEWTRELKDRFYLVICDEVQSLNVTSCLRI